MAAPKQGKEQEISRLLLEGILPVEVIRQGYSRGTVYKVNRRLKGGDTDQHRIGSATEKTSVMIDPGVENDPDVVGLKKTLRMVELKHQIEEINGPSDMGARLAKLEQTVKAVTQLMELLGNDVDTLGDKIVGSPLAGLREKFECACGQSGLVAVKVTCTACNRDTNHGWWP